MDVTIKERKIEKIVERTIFRILQRVLTDPDFGLELSEKAKKRLRQASVSKQKTVPFSDIKKKYY